jgi:hypothetical protein
MNMTGFWLWCGLVPDLMVILFRDLSEVWMSLRPLKIFCTFIWLYWHLLVWSDPAWAFPIRTDCVTILLNVLVGGTVRWKWHITPDLCLATSWLHDYWHLPFQGTKLACCTNSIDRNRMMALGGAWLPETSYSQEHYANRALAVQFGGIPKSYLHRPNYCLTAVCWLWM